MTSRRHAVPLAIATTAVAVALLIALLVGWTLVIADRLSEHAEGWLLVLGIVFFAVILVAAVATNVRLVRQIREVRAQTRFVDSVTHEFKSPLASLLLSLETLEHPQLSDHQRAEVVAMMRGDVERLGAFIDDVLAASRLGRSISEGERGEGRAEAEPVSLAQAAQRAAQRARERYAVRAEGGDAAPTPAPALAVEIPPDVRVRVDPTALDTILINLVDNAVRYSDPPADVRVTTEPAPRGALDVLVTDRGIGIARRDLRAIFHRFHRANDPRVRTRSGTGLGLAVAHETAASAGLRLSAHSDGPGQGSTFRLRVPARLLHGA